MLKPHELVAFVVFINVVCTVAAAAVCLLRVLLCVHVCYCIYELYCIYRNTWTKHLDNFYAQTSLHTLYTHIHACAHTCIHPHPSQGYFLDIGIEMGC